MIENELEKFVEYFKDFNNEYVILGGIASSIAMNKAGLEFRKTRDVDMVLIVEELSKDFHKRFMEFLKDGGYKYYKSKDGQERYYRFQEPQKEGFPAQIELFSRKQDIFKDQESATIMPVVFGKDVSSLSAIILNDNYYELLNSGKEDYHGLSILKPEYIILFKAFAYLDLKKKKSQGENIDQKTIKKHKNDIYRLASILEGDELVKIQEDVRNDMREFILNIEEDQINLAQLDVPVSKEDIIKILKEIYSL